MSPRQDRPLSALTIAGSDSGGGAVVGAVLEATNEVAARIGDAERAAVRRHFRATGRYEWMFWDMGYRCEQ